MLIDSTVLIDLASLLLLSYLTIRVFSRLFAEGEYDLRKPIQNTPSAPYLSWIQSGIKTYEGRLATKIREWELRVGKKIVLFDADNAESYVRAEITELLNFPDFGAAFDQLGTTLIPGGKTRDEVVRLYNGMYCYHFENPDEIPPGEPSQMIRVEGVVAIKLRILDIGSSVEQ